MPIEAAEKLLSVKNRVSAGTALPRPLMLTEAIREVATKSNNPVAWRSAPAPMPARKSLPLAAPSVMAPMSAPLRTLN